MQMWEDRQEHELPIDNERRTALAHRCGFNGQQSLERFDRKHQRVRTQVREIVGRHFLTTTQEEDAMMALVVQGEADERLAGIYLTKAGLLDHKQACVHLRQLASEPFFVLSRSRTERSLVKILPLLLHLISQCPHPDQALGNFVRIVEAVGGRAIFYDLLGSRADVLTMFADLAGWSKFLVQLMHDFPGLPDEVIDTLNKRLRTPAVLAIEARSLIAGLASPGEPLAFMVARETAAVAMHDLEGMTQQAVGEQLTATAAAVFQALLPRIISNRAHEWGIPMERKRPTRFAVLALGKLGSKELTYASDMDVLFVSDPGGQCPKAKYDGDTFWLRIAQNLMSVMQDSRIYEIDPRLRPWGDGGPMVANTEALAHYWSAKRDMWERMAMLRVSYLAGDPHLADEAIALIRQAAFTQPVDDQARHEVRAMRQRLEESVQGRDHVKRGWGGYVDHEFIAQFLCLGLDPKQIPIGCATEDMLIRLGELGRIPVVGVEALINSLRTLRFAEARMRLSEGKAISSLPTEIPRRTHLARRCDFPDLEAFNLALHVARETGRHWFDRLI
jgi:glutamate-ammonia-ligase adenylyltransferase